MAKWLGVIHKGVVYPPIPEQLPEEIANKLVKLIEEDLKGEYDKKEAG